MPDVRYFAGNSLAAFLRSATSVAESTTAGRFDSGFVGNSISLAQSQSMVSPEFGPATGTLWVRFDLYIATSLNATATQFQVSDGATGVFRLRAASGSSSGLTPEFWNGSAWVAGTAFTAVLNSLQTYSIKVKFGVSYTVYLGGIVVASGSMSGSPPSQATNISMTCVGAAGCNFSQIMAANYDLRDSKYSTKALAAASSVHTGAASGTYPDINETVLDEGTSVVITTAANKAGYTKAALTVPVGYVIGAMVVNGRGRATGAITDGKLGVRSGGGVDSSGAGLAFAAAYEPRSRIIENDPDTATRFTESGFNSAEVYIEAV